MNCNLPDSCPWNSPGKCTGGGNPPVTLLQGDLPNPGIEPGSFFGLQNHCDGDCSHEIKRPLLLGSKESYDQPRQHIKKQRRYFANKGPSSQGYGFSSSHIWMWELDYKESWAPKNWCFWTVVLEKSLESPLDCKEIQPVHPKGDQSWILNCKDWCWSWNSSTFTTWCEELTH